MACKSSPRDQETTAADEVQFTSILESPLNIKDRLSQLNKNLYKTKLFPEKIEKLEREAMRGEGIMKSEVRAVSKPSRTKDLMTLILQSEHKATLEGTQIIKLPKLPFGKHCSYNEDPLFKEKHFLENEVKVVSSEREKELASVIRKFKLNEKRYKANKKNRLQTAKPTLADFGGYDVYNMGPGRLICNKEVKVINSYEIDKEKYKEFTKGMYAATFQEVDCENLVQRYTKRKVLNWREEEALISRIIPRRKERESALSQFYSTRYSSLFEEKEQKSVKFHARHSSIS